MKKLKGSGLVDYVVPTAIVGIMLGLGLYYLYSNGLLLKFTAASGNMQIQMDKEMAVVGQRSDFTAALNCDGGGCFGGTQQQPVKKCFSKFCIIDFGDYVLRNVPENFGEFAEATGSSGGTDVLLELIKQMANIVDDPETPDDEGYQLRDLANIGHFLSDYEKYIEEHATGCLSAGNEAQQIDCMKTIQPANMNVPENIMHLVPDLDKNQNHINFELESMLYFGEYARECFDNNQCGATMSENPAEAFFKVHYDIQESGNYDQNVKNLTEVLYGQMAYLGDNLRKLTKGLSGQSQAQEFDPLTGENAGYPPQQFTLDDMLHPNTSTITDVDSALICSLGGTPPEGESCP